MEPRTNNINTRFSFGRQSSLDPIRRTTPMHEMMSLPGNLDSTMQLLFVACKGDVAGVKEVLDEDGVDVNSIDLDGRTALHIAASEGHVEVVKFLLSRKANIDARDRWGSTVGAYCLGLGPLEAGLSFAFYDGFVFDEFLVSRGARGRSLRMSKGVHGFKVSRSSKPFEELASLLLFAFYDGFVFDVFVILKVTLVCVDSLFGARQGKLSSLLRNGTRKLSVKILDKDSYSDTDPESINAFKHELTLLEKVRHPNVVQFVGAVTQNVPMMIVSEFHPRGDLRSYLQKKGRLSPSKALSFALDIARQVAGIALIRLSKISPNKARLARPATVDRENLYIAPEIYKDELFDGGVDVYSFGIILYEMMEGVQPFYPKPPEEAVKLMCVDVQRPTFKTKSKYYPPDLKELIEECWYPDLSIRPKFSEIIIRLDKIVGYSSKQGWFKDTFKLPWK
ncbi:integrin-linked protein kinase 1-like protein [Tanacetum coccineum]